MKAHGNGNEDIEEKAWNYQNTRATKFPARKKKKNAFADLLTVELQSARHQKMLRSSKEKFPTKERESDWHQSSNPYHICQNAVE